MLNLTWADFDAAIDHIAISVGNIKGVCGVPRGGLPLAVAISHRLDGPFHIRAGKDILILDDIRDSGTTIAKSKLVYPQSPLFVWVTREKHPTDYRAVITDIGEDWVVFPWEDPCQAEQDRDRYMEAHP